MSEKSNQNEIYIKSSQDDRAEIIWDDGNVAKGNKNLNGAVLIQEFVKNLPNKSGVYRMFDEDGTVLYVGKARNLKKRVANYARGQGHSNRITRMISLTYHMEFVVTHTETEALLLEANLIKRYHPRFNILLRDDKSFPYILITRDHRAPAIFKHRGARTRKGDYFGPFADSTAVTHTINAIERAFLLRSCTDSMFESRTRPCLLHQIKRCAAPCTHEISDENYLQLVQEATDFLSGKSRKIQDKMAKAMHEASENLDFEHAAVFRDRLAALSHVQGRQGVIPQTIEEADVFAISQQGGMTCIQVFFFRASQNWGNRAYFPKADQSFTASEVLSAFIAQFYDNKPIAKLILLSEKIAEEEILTEALQLKSDRKIQLMVPQRGERKQFVDHAYNNAREALGRRLAETSSQEKLLEATAKTFGLKKTPKRIEVYDNSHIMGTNAVGGMIVAGKNGFIKNQYRKFNIRGEDITPGDDFGMMKEVIERRFSGLIKEHGLPSAKKSQAIEENDELPAWPDLILIDGGEGQMSAVREILQKLGIENIVTAIGVAKGVDRNAGRERFFIENQLPFSLPPRDPVLYFLQRLRDEAHRFAIGTHRAKRKKELIKNPLDEIDGIGPTRKRALLSHFGTAKAVSRAAVEDLIKVNGISAAIAKIIHNHFHEK